MAVQAAERALDAAQALLEAGPRYYMLDRQMSVCRAYNLLLSGSWHAGNLTETLRMHWIVQRIDRKAFPTGLSEANLR